MHKRYIYESEYHSKLAKLKKGSTSTEISMDFSFYSRKFMKDEECEDEEELE